MELKILLVDDHKVVRDGMKYMLDMQDNLNVTVQEAEDGKDAVERSKHIDYDIIIMDINMPDMDGIEACEKILAEKKDAKILALSMHEEEFQIKKMITAGAKGYMLKSAGAEELMKAIKKVAAGEKYYGGDVAMKLMEPYHDAIIDGKAVENRLKGKLTEREMEVLKLIANEYTNGEIAEKLHVSKRTVDTHRQNLLNKLNAKNTAGLTKYAVENKLLD